jgi:hypothetical protein
MAMAHFHHLFEYRKIFKAARWGYVPRAGGCFLAQVGYGCNIYFQTSTASFACTFGKPDKVGMRTEKQVTFPPEKRTLRNRIVPSYFCRIPLLIQRPNPVPFVDLVLKNGSKSLFASSGRMPAPLSVMETRTPAG